MTFNQTSYNNELTFSFCLFVCCCVIVVVLPSLFVVVFCLLCCVVVESNRRVPRRCKLESSLKHHGSRWFETTLLCVEEKGKVSGWETRDASPKGTYHGNSGDGCEKSEFFVWWFWVWRQTPTNWMIVCKIIGDLCPQTCGHNPLDSKKD